MNGLKAMLSASIQHYAVLLAMYETIDNDKGSTNLATLQSRCIKILQLHTEIARGDDALTLALQTETHNPAAISPALPLIERRLSLMRRAFNHNRSLLATIQNIQSLLAHEIKEMQGGRAALHGYRQTSSPEHGSILNASR
jgi:hypothetical protein